MSLGILGGCALAPGFARAQVGTSNPILFVTQNPVGGFTTATSVFGNHRGSIDAAPRGGDLVIRYGDGSLRFLTAEAGYGDASSQGASAIAVREPAVHWDATKALFSMVVGGPELQYQRSAYFWQIYEVTGLGVGENAVIRKVANQPTNANNVSPIYATDGRILFVSDRPASGAAHHYPQLDEYESTPIVTGIYSLDESAGVLELLENAPSGVTSLSLDSFGRVIFTKWDHLQRDQQGDTVGAAATYEAFTYASEAEDAATTTAIVGAEVFPEPRRGDTPDYEPHLEPHSFNHFFPWEINEDGTAEETLNHVGRHELGGSFTEGSFTADPNLTYYVSPSLHANDFYLNGSAGLFHLREDPTSPGDFLTTYAPEFATASGGVLLRINGAPGENPDEMVLEPVTPSDEEATVPDDTGYFRNPLPLSDGALVAVHTAATRTVTNEGSAASPDWNYEYRLTNLVADGDRFVADQVLTSGISKNLSWWTPDVRATFSGNLWELDPVEVVVRSVPTPRVSTLPSVEAAVFAQEEVSVAEFRDYLRSNELALIVGRDVTQRERSDRQQPFNLSVPGGVSSVSDPGTVYDISHLQIFQADALRGYGDPTDPAPGRRLLARPMHGAGVSQSLGAPLGGVRLGLDGSFAAIVPARRALTWQLTDPSGEGVVRERNWISFQAGEIRVCASCHGINTASQTGEGEPENEPQALRDLLVAWKNGDTGGESCTSGIVFDKAKLRSKADPFSLQLAAEAILPEPWQAINPAEEGLRVFVTGLIDATIAGGEGWKIRGRRWTYNDPLAASGSIKRVKVVDRRNKQAGRIAVHVVAVGPATLLPSGSLVAEVGFGAPQECASLAFNEPQASCRARPGRLKCKTN